PETTIGRIKDKAIKESGLPKIRIHDFRHSFVSMLISKGADVSIISKYVGHSSIKQTLDTYTHMYQSKMEEIIKNL
ncbi:MAG: tyrosine-type recombinase/integrase, partial [Erysipelotrichaceae bacterium]|nr:tyrosine-type recombinase/integrase [Erysipelotrichaceae bacterium]